MVGESAEIRHKINTALDFMPTAEAEDDLLPHLRWQARLMLSRVTPEDLLAPELMAIIAILAPAHARVLRIPTGGRPVLRILPGDQPAESS